MLSIIIKFNMIIVDNFFLYHTNFCVSRRRSFFTGCTKYYALWATGSKYLRAFQCWQTTWIRTKCICGIYLSLCTVISGNYVHSIYSSLLGKCWIILYITFILFVIWNIRSQARLNAWQQTDVQKVEWRHSTKDFYFS